jgi:Ca2+-binding RTX toxin-like protein
MDHTMKLTRTAIGIVAVVGVVMGPLPAAGAGPMAASTVPTVVSVSSGTLRISSPDVDSSISVHDVAGDTIAIRDALNPIVAVAPCVFDTLLRAALCPADQVSSVLIQTGAGNDQVVSSTAASGFVVTGAGNDVVAAGIFSSDILAVLGDGDDVADAGSGAFDVFGGLGRDLVSYRVASPVAVSLDDVANDGSGNRDDNVHSDVEDIFGGAGNDILVGSDDANLISGEEGDDTIVGMGGDDLFAAQGRDPNFPDGADAMFGGPGTDTVSYADRADAVTVWLDDLAFDGRPGENDNVHSDVENITGSPNADVLTGSAAPNEILGRDGNDLLDGGSGADLITGGAGVDTATYASRTAGVTARLDGLANDGETSEGDNLQTENVTGGAGNDLLAGDGLRNTLSGGPGNDVLNGLGQDDVLGGGPGTDLIDAGPGSDAVTYADHIAPVTVSLDGVANDGQAGEKDAVLNAEHVIGGNGNDTLVGNASPNTLRGLLGNDRLFGLDGDDTLIGSEGTDFADGGPGVDHCQVESSLRCP